MKRLINKYVTMLAGLGVWIMPTLVMGAAKIDMQPGEWETTAVISSSSLPIQMPPSTTRRCVTKEDLVPPSNNPSKDCKVTEKKIEKGAFNWKVACPSKDGGKMTMTGTIRYTGTTMTGKMDMQMVMAGNTVKMTYNLKGKRLGDCK